MQKLTDIQKEWIAALRSGKYKQEARALRTYGDRFCCLGVLCELAAKKGVIPYPRLNDDRAAYSYQGYSGFLPPEIITWVRLRGGMITQSILADMNDRGESFEHIANVLNSNPERYFYTDTN